MKMYARFQQPSSSRVTSARHMDMRSSSAGFLNPQKRTPELDKAPGPQNSYGRTP